MWFHLTHQSVSNQTMIIQMTWMKIRTLLRNRNLMMMYHSIKIMRDAITAITLMQIRHPLMVETDQMLATAKQMIFLMSLRNQNRKTLGYQTNGIGNSGKERATHGNNAKNISAERKRDGNARILSAYVKRNKTYEMSMVIIARLLKYSKTFRMRRDGEKSLEKREIRYHTPKTHGKQKLRFPDPPSQSTPHDDHVDRDSDQMDTELDFLNKLVREGRAKFISFLLAQAVKSDERVPEKYSDIARLPIAEQKEWMNTCNEELEALKKHDVFKITDLPPGKKAIKNRWVFATKSDGRKKARLVAKGFSQVEGIDFDEIFSQSFGTKQYEQYALCLPQQLSKTGAS
ncbi:putative encoded by [Lyophyllum shimeji]|uniref:Encoded by n=1 Tax=Lyophyllum shimeji TaxID=47721 RepID=A0A9P3Q0F3_LYOSH|nr:putative encoded by [Lyophyllum shimeji]